MRVRAFPVAMVALLAACASAPSSDDPSVSPSAADRSPPAVGSFTPHATPSPSAAPREVDLIGELLSVVTTDLVVRSRPGTGSDSEIYPARLDAPTLVYVIDGPEEADGYAWYLVDPVTLPCYFGCDFAPRPGWVAAADTDGERWLAAEPATSPCPEPTLEGVSGADPQLRLYCFGSDELTLTGGVVGTEGWHRARWLWPHQNYLYGPDYRPSPGCVDLCNVPLLSIFYDGDGDPPQPMSMPSLTGHFDDARAADCGTSVTGIDPRVVTYECRMVFVVTSWE